MYDHYVILINSIIIITYIVYKLKYLIYLAYLFILYLSNYIDTNIIILNVFWIQLDQVHCFLNFYFASITSD